ncbi:carboxymuconolactone decarboxylase family protein [Haloferula sp.]|uniref:carboxymuconolactone decarboxylase family protein n=1 Tax=Haloferula sp. TaxID=2497595 RepID=UPI0032A09195
MKLNLQSIESAPESSRPLLEGAQASFGFIPNLLGTLANAPAALEGYLALSGALGKSSLSPVEQEVITITASVENGCRYCVAGHTTIGQMRKVDADVLVALREGMAIADPKLESLREFTLAVVRDRGWVSEEQQEAFFKAGYTPAQALEVVLGVTMKTLSNYTNHLVKTPLDPAFAANEWRESATV